MLVFLLLGVFNLVRIIDMYLTDNYFHGSVFKVDSGLTEIQSASQ
jgi:hypothetical protein